MTFLGEVCVKSSNVVNRRGIWEIFWVWAGRVPLRSKIIGIVIAPLLILGTTMAWWVRNELGGWLSYLLSEERVAQAMSVGMRGVFIITLISAVAGLGIAWFLTWLLTRPILQITYVAAHVKNGGDLSLRAPVWANDEIGRLGHAFNAMIDSLQRSRDDLHRSNRALAERNKELAVLYELAQVAGQPSTRLAVLDYSLQRSLEVVAADAGILLTSSNGDNLTVATSYNLSPEFLTRGIQAQEGGAFLLEVMRGGEARYIVDISDYAAAPTDLIAACIKENVSTVVLFPLQGQDTVLGIWMVLFRRPVTLIEHEMRLLSAIRGQLSVALENTQLWEKLRQKERIRAQLLNRVVSAQEEERRRISRELHDETGQALTSLLIQLKVLERQSSAEGVQTRVEELRKTAAGTLQEVRRLAADLRPSALDDLGLMPALESYIDAFSHQTGIIVAFDVETPDNFRLPRDVEITLYRMIQEALTNIARHSQASSARIAITQDSATLHIRITDDGCGFDVAQALHSSECGLGLLGMRERIEIVSGRLWIESQPGQGTTIKITLPLG